MKILLTNDDGIQSEGLMIVAKWAKKLGDVTVSAPKFEQSGKSHSIDIHNPFEVKKVDYLDGVRAFSVDSSPADCVRFATLGLHETYDLVISGINKGLNLGEDIMYSATNGAIFEACTRGLKALALSTHVQSFDDAQAWLDRIYDSYNETTSLPMATYTTSTSRRTQNRYCSQSKAARTSPTISSILATAHGDKKGIASIKTITI